MTSHNATHISPSPRHGDEEMVIKALSDGYGLDADEARSLFYDGGYIIEDVADEDEACVHLARCLVEEDVEQMGEFDIHLGSLAEHWIKRYASVVVDYARIARDLKADYYHVEVGGSHYFYRQD